MFSLTQIANYAVHIKLQCCLLTVGYMDTNSQLMGALWFARLYLQFWNYKGDISAIQYYNKFMFVTHIESIVVIRQWWYQP